MYLPYFTVYNENKDDAMVGFYVIDKSGLRK